MRLRLIRREYREDGIFSELVNEKSKVLAQCLEHSYNLKPKLPPGVYKCFRGIHKLHDLKPFDTFEVCGVPNHSGILLHVGNWQSASEGCILIGHGVAQSSKGQMITASKQAFAELMDYLKDINNFELKVQA